MYMGNWGEKRMLQCVQCGAYYPGSVATDGGFVPAGSASGGKCHSCGNDVFEQVMFASSV